MHRICVTMIRNVIAGRCSLRKRGFCACNTLKCYNRQRVKHRLMTSGSPLAVHHITLHAILSPEHAVQWAWPPLRGWLPSRFPLCTGFESKGCRSC